VSLEVYNEFRRPESLEVTFSDRWSAVRVQSRGLGRRLDVGRVHFRSTCLLFSRPTDLIDAGRAHFRLMQAEHGVAPWIPPTSASTGDSAAAVGL
jgi:hypothetical protein